MTQTMVNDFMAEHSLKHHLVTSAKSSEGVDELFQTLGALLYDQHTGAGKFVDETRSLSDITQVDSKKIY